MTTTYNILAISSQGTMVPWQGGTALRLRGRGGQGNVLPQRVESPPRTSFRSQSISRVLLSQPCHQREQPLEEKSDSCSSLVNLGLSWLLTILAWWGLICLLLWISWWTHWQCSTKVGPLIWQTRKRLSLLALVSNCTQRCPFDLVRFPIPSFFEPGKKTFFCAASLPDKKGVYWEIIITNSCQYSVQCVSPIFSGTNYDQICFFEKKR